MEGPIEAFFKNLLLNFLSANSVQSITNGYSHRATVNIAS